MAVPCDICSGEGIKSYTGIHIERTSDKDWDSHCETFCGERPEGKQELVGRKDKKAWGGLKCLLVRLAGINKS